MFHKFSVYYIMRSITIPSDAVIELSLEDHRPVEQHTGDLTIFIDKVVYMRNTPNGNGLLRMMTGVDITVTKTWYDLIFDNIANTDDYGNN